MEKKTSAKKENKLGLAQILCLIILLSLYLPGIFYLAKVDSPNYSKEPLRPFPKAEINRDFGGGFENWWSDHFPLRSLMITGYNKFLKTGFQTSGNKRVLVGQDNWYFFQPTVRDYLRAEDLTPVDYQRIAESFRIQEEYLARQNIPFHVFLVPNKNTVYPEHMPAYLQALSNPSSISRMKAAYPQSYDLTPLLVSLKDSPYPVYHKEDSHWTGYGAMEAYKSLMESVGKPPKDFGPPLVTQDWEGDLTNMLYPAIRAQDINVTYPDFSQNFIFTRPLRSREDLDITSKSKETGKLLVFRDSFSNAWMDFISQSFGQVRYSKAFPYNYSLTEGEGYDAVIVEMVERNLDYFLQAAPELKLPKLGQIPEAGEGPKLAAKDCSAQGNIGYLNNYLLPDEAKNYSAVKVLTDQGAFTAFPIFQDGEITDRKWANGFSFYSDQPLQVEAVFLFEEGRWIRHSLVKS